MSSSGAIFSPRAMSRGIIPLTHRLFGRLGCQAFGDLIMKQPATPKQPWERREWPSKGDADINLLWRTLGQCLSRWEEYENFLSSIFSYFVAKRDWPGGRRPYHAVRAFEARAEMLRAASEAYFAENPDETLLTAFKQVLRDATCYAARRNEMAHGAIGAYQSSKDARPLGTVEAGHALYPSAATFKWRDVKGTPEYCYTSAELIYFHGQLDTIEQRAWDLMGAFAKKHGPTT